MKLTLEDIRKRREFLSSKSSEGTTSAPCHGCGGQVEGHRGRFVFFRKKDRLCNECRELMEYALDSREQALVSHDHGRKLYEVIQRGFREGRYNSRFHMRRTNDPHDPEKDSPSDAILHAMFLLFGQLDGGFPKDDFDPEENLYGNTAWQEYGYPLSTKAWLTPEAARLMRMLDSAVRRALIERTECGEEYGRSLLAGLADGSVSIDKFNEASIGKEKRR